MPARNGFHKFTSGATPANLLTASMAASRVIYIHVAEVGWRNSFKLIKKQKNELILISFFTWVDSLQIFSLRPYPLLQDKITIKTDRMCSLPKTIGFQTVK